MTGPEVLGLMVSVASAAFWTGYSTSTIVARRRRLSEITSRIARLEQEGLTAVQVAGLLDDLDQIGHRR